MDAETHTLYFAYGSNMQPAQMQRRCAGAVPVGKARLTGWRIRIGHRGVATVVVDAHAETWGVLWWITDRHVEVLDRHEGVASGHYRVDHLDVEGPDGVVRARIYVEEFVYDAPPREGYLERLVEGARHFDLPAHHQRALAALAPASG